MVYKPLRRMIIDQIRGYQALGETEFELGEQDAFRLKLVRHFHDRESTIADIDGYLFERRNKIFALVGPSGSGKSSVMAKVITDTLEKHKENGVVVYRFLGISPLSSNREELLKSLCAKITQKYCTTPEELLCRDITADTDEEKERRKKAELDSLNTYNGLLKLFHLCLNLALPDRRLVIFLDALDQRSGYEKKHQLNWLPGKLPPNSSIVVSCLPALDQHFSDCETHHLPVFPSNDAAAILDTWLANTRNNRNEPTPRNLTESQKTAIIDAFEKSGSLPIFLRLAYEWARKWRSDTCFAKCPEVHRTAISANRGEDVGGGDGDAV
jgi:ABC-type oligopeptide transport system ATPase subunit